MAATSESSRAPRRRADSFQRMLDLEREYKFARLQSAQTSSQLELSCPLPILPDASLVQKSCLVPIGSLAQTKAGDFSFDSFCETHTNSSLAATIHSSKESSDDCKRLPDVTNTDRSKKPIRSQDDVAITLQKVPGSGLSYGDDFGSGKDSDEEKMSEQSSICQSPSWECYDQRKDKKKREKKNANQKRRSKRKGPEQAESATSIPKEPKEATKKTHYNKLQKTRPLDNPKALPTASGYQTFTDPRNRQGTCYSDLLADVIPAVGTPQSRSIEKSKYPPTSSRTHILKNTLLSDHAHHNSPANFISSPGVSSRKDRVFSRRLSHNHCGYNSENHLDQSLDMPFAKFDRGRQTSVSDQRRVDPSRRSRTRSIERSITDFVGGAASTVASILPSSRGRSRVNKHKSLCELPLDEQSREEDHSIQGYGRRCSAQLNGSTNSISQQNVAITTSEHSIYGPAQESILHGDLAMDSYQTEQQSQFCTEQRDNDYLQESPKHEQQMALSTLFPVATNTEREYSLDADYLGLFSKPYTSTDSPTGASLCDMFLTVKSHVSHKERTPNEPPTHRKPQSFRDRAMRALYLLSVEKGLVGSVASGVPGEPVDCSPLLPPEIKQASFRTSEGSSASSYCGNSCTIPSTTTTPGTSRPQSEKGIVESLKKPHAGDTSFMSCQGYENSAYTIHHRDRGIREVQGSDIENCSTLDRPGSPSLEFKTEPQRIDGQCLESVSDLSNHKKTKNVSRIHGEKAKVSVRAIRRQHSAKGQRYHGLASTTTATASSDGKQSMEKNIVPTVSTTTKPLTMREARIEPLQEARRSHPRISSLESKIRMSAPSPIDPPRPEFNVATPDEIGLHSKFLVEETGISVQPKEKLLVECCHCKFLHDMPSRVYDCMTRLHAMVTDHTLGVSEESTAVVKCPWCSHSMSTRCCAGYTAIVYLKERLH